MTIQQRLAFDQPIVRPPHFWNASHERGMTEIERSAEPKLIARERFGPGPARHAIVDAMSANASAIVTSSFRSPSENTSTQAKYVGAFLDTQPSLALELDRIRALLSEGLVRDAHSVIAEAFKKFPHDESLYTLSKLTAPRKATRLAVKFPRRDQEIRWLDENREEYKGKWVALLGHDLIASADTMKQVLDAVAKKNIESAPLVHKVE